MCARRESGVWLTFADHQHVVVLFVVVQAHLRATSPLATTPLARSQRRVVGCVAGARTLQRSSSSSDTSNRCSDSTHECNSRSVKASSRVARAAIGEPTALYLPSPSMTRTSDRGGGGHGTAGGLGGARSAVLEHLFHIRPELLDVRVLRLPNNRNIGQMPNENADKKHKTKQKTARPRSPGSCRKSG